MKNKTQNEMLQEYKLLRDGDLNHANRADLWVYGGLTLKQYLGKTLSPLELDCYSFLRRIHWNERLLASRMRRVKANSFYRAPWARPLPPVVAVAAAYLHSVLDECYPIPPSTLSTPKWFNEMRGSSIIL